MKYLRPKILATLVPLCFSASLFAQTGSPTQRAFTAGKYAIELDGIMSLVSNLDGGNPSGIVVEDPPNSASFVSKKHIGGVKYEDFSITAGTGMGKGFCQWIKDSFDHKVTRKNGAIVAADYKRTFTNALISEVSFPALDAASKDPAYMILKITPETTVRTPAITKFPQTIRQKAWLVSNFRLNIDGLDCTRVNKIEALTVKQKNISTPDPAGSSSIEPTKIEYPNLVITMPESSADSFHAWNDDFLLKGNNDDSKEKSGTLEYLANDGSVLFTLNFSHVGIFDLSEDASDQTPNGIKKVKVELYVEEMTFNYK